MTSEFLAISVIVLGLGAYVEIIFDWLVSSSKLQSCLKLPICLGMSQARIAR
jgi:hypothetical protein